MHSRRTLAAVVLAFSFLACSGESYSFGPDGSRSSSTPVTTPQPIGGRCSNDGECQGSSVCNENWPNGYCMQYCAGSSCPSGICTRLTDATVCLASCRSSSDCRPGYECEYGGNGVSICIPL